MSAVPPYRLFFAAWPDDACRHWLDQQVERLHDACHGRQVPPRQLHLTLAFVGEVDPARLCDVYAVGERVAAEAEACRLRLARLAVWPNGIGCALPARVPGRLARLARALNGALADAGLPHEARAFKPHLTLLRKAQAGEAGVPHPDAPALFAVDHLSLVVSRLTRSGPIYQELRRWPLPAPTPPA
ncbi:RNA 2',3'-cyclic phosphodiesterase [Crenobacter caeni]|uniref:RNA 2',3'-cyclic phosphodiesterase n=1 Tax=Crenobacter caeni TaxID=2705474 RepID=A0A6B2KLZ4_9NEIS|nr:RNA 2',3'-cyclic phosphodiesterase [Crenobacter caeni]NDV11246.1 RNA 2',3'-cyclic phosphodiesterase [Crenobacter caeni]